MEFYANPLRTLVVLSSSIFPNLIERFREHCSNFSTVFPVLGYFFSVFLRLCFALVGSMLGLVSGALIGHETESGFVRGSAIGAMSGAVLSIEAFDSFVLLWRSNESTIGCLLFLIDVFSSLFSGRLAAQERMGLAILSALQSQQSEVGAGYYVEFSNIFDIDCGVKGLSGHILQKIPTVKITESETLDSSGEKLSCSVCLQDYHIGEAVRRLPHCRHIFHLACIDKWLKSRGSCPLCRHHL